MSGLRGRPSALREFGSRLSKLSTELAQDVAQDAAPALTGLAGAAYDSGRTVYGEPRPLGVDGRQLTLDRTGAARAGVRFSATGTVVRCVLGERYTRYLIGKYSILPNGALPKAWGERLSDIARQRFGEVLR